MWFCVLDIGGIQPERFLLKANDEQQCLQLLACTKPIQEAYQSALQKPYMQQAEDKTFLAWLRKGLEVLRQVSAQELEQELYGTVEWWNFSLSNSLDEGALANKLAKHKVLNWNPERNYGANIDVGQAFPSAGSPEEAVDIDINNLFKPVTTDPDWFLDQLTREKNMKTAQKLLKLANALDDAELHFQADQVDDLVCLAKKTKEGKEPDIPDKVVEIADAIRRDNPDFSDEKAYRMAWETYVSYVNPSYEGGTSKGRSKRKSPKSDYSD